MSQSQLKFAALVLLTIFQLSTHSRADTWTITTVASDSWFDLTYGSQSAVLDSEGRVHLFYVGDGLYHVSSNADGTWTREIVAGVGGTANKISNNVAVLDAFDEDPTSTQYLKASEAVSAALDSSGRFHVSFYNDIDHVLNYATNSSGSWTVETIDNTNNPGSPNALAIDSEGYIHIAYYTGVGGDLMYAINKSDDWIVEAVHGTSGDWVSETVQSTNNVGSYLDLVIGGSDVPHILYYNSTDTTLHHVSKTGGAWVDPIQVDSATNVGEYVSLDYVASLDVLVASYFDKGNGDLKFASKSASGAWVTEVLDSQTAGKQTTIHVMGDDRVAVAYQDYPATGTEGSAMHLAFGTHNGSTFSWLDEEIKGASASSDSTGYDPEIVANAVGDVAVLYKYHRTEFDQILTYATGAFANLIEVIDSSHFMGRNASLVLAEEADSRDDRPSDDIFIAYEDFINADLKLARYYESIDSWTNSVLYDDAYYGVEARGTLNISPNGLLSIPFISDYDLFYLDESAADTWDPVEDVGIFNEMELSAEIDFQFVTSKMDSTGVTHLLYSQDPVASGTNSGLYYTTSASELWEKETVYASDASVPVLLLDDSNKPYVIYKRASTEALVFAERNPDDGTWTSTDIVSGNVSYPAAALTMLPEEDPFQIHLVYHDEDTDEIKYGVYQAGFWTLSTALTDQVGRSAANLFANDNGPMLSLDLAVSNETVVPHMSYYDSASATLKHAWLDAGTWFTDTIDDTGGTTGTSSSLKVDESGKIHVAYFALSHFDLRYATNVRCGDGVRSGSEQCDDGNTDDTDECHNDCTVNLEDTSGSGVATEPTRDSAASSCSLNRDSSGQAAASLWVMTFAFSGLLALGMKKRFSDRL